jgi:hypothetical protein
MQTGTANIDTQTILEANLKQFKADGFQQVFVAHFGAINQDLVNRLSEQVEEMLYSAGAKKTIIKRIFSIVVEGLQNVLLHGEKYGSDQISMLIVGASPDQFKISMGNITAVSEKEKLYTYVDHLNSMDNDEVKAYYLETLNNGLISEKGGAGLGFITMRMKSKHWLHADFIEWSDSQSFFVISAVLDKSE